MQTRSNLQVNEEIRHLTSTTIKLDHHPPTRKDGLELDRLEGGKEGLTGTLILTCKQIFKHRVIRILGRGWGVAVIQPEEV